MSFELQGTPPTGASVTSGTVSTFAALSAGNITINTVAVPAIPGGANAAAQVDQLVAAINSVYSQTGVEATKVTSTTYKLQAGVNIVVAALAGTATLANTGLTAGTTTATEVLIASRKQFGTNKTPSDEDVVNYGNGWMTVRAARKAGFITTVAGADVDVQKAQTPTRTDA